MRIIETSLALVALCACSGGGTSDTASGGTSPGGGMASGGATQSLGGSVATGGLTNLTGGAPASGGANASGGAAAQGGSIAAGGTLATGGSSPLGGAIANGGTSSGGSTSAGGVTSGGSSSGGAQANGGAVGSGGKAGSGGTASSGANGAGQSSTGGSATGGSATGGALATGGSAGSGLLVPAQGALLGAFVGTGTFAELETTLGRKLAIIHSFFGWSDDWVARVPSDLSAGRIPLITWETWNAGVGVSLDDIANGAHDALIRSRATSAKNVGQKFFLRWGHEMNGNWYPWDGSHNGANAAAASKYIAVYRHIHDIFTSQGATNVIWIFCPNADSVPGDAWNQWANYYPGDAYVDWMGFDGYNWGTSQATSSWQAFSAIASRIYPSLAAKNKPIIIPETASAEVGGDKAAWIASMVPAFRSNYPNIKALVWFHMNKETDWRLDSSAATRQASITLAQDPYFNP